MTLGACLADGESIESETFAPAPQIHALTRQECEQHPEASTARGWLKSRFEACFIGHELVELKCKNCVTKLASVEFDYSLFVFAYDGERRVDYVLQFDDWKALGGVERETSTLRVTFNGCGGTGNCSPSFERISMLRDWAANRRFEMTFTSPDTAGQGPYVINQLPTTMDMEIRTPNRPDFDPWYRPNMAFLLVRFDTAGAKAGKFKGSVFPEFIPTFKLPANQDPRAVREAMRHIDDALHHPERTQPAVPGKSIPGERTPLHRLLDDAKIERNRTASTSHCQSPRPSGLECDEYPFASAHEGASTAVLQPWHGSVRLIPADDNRKAGDALRDFYFNNRLLENDPFYVTVDARDISLNITCSVFDDGYSNLVGPSDAIFFSDGRACIGDGTSAGECRKWFGRCATENGEPVLFRVFDDGEQGASQLSDAVFINDDEKACTPDGGSGYCKKWFGNPQTDGGEAVECRLFGDGYADMTGPTRAIYYNDDQRICLPDGTSMGTCRKWFGRCQTASLGPVLPGGQAGSGDPLPSIAPSVSIDSARIVIGSDGTATLQAQIVSGGSPVSVSWTYGATSDVDAGAACTFSNPSNATTALSCTDDGTFVVTVTVTDGVHAPAAASAEVRIPNRAPALQLTAAPEEWSVHFTGTAQTFEATVSDPEVNDAVVCTITWDDGTIEELLPEGGVCLFEHSFWHAGMYTIQLVAEDDDGGRAEVERMIIVTSRVKGSVAGVGAIHDLTTGGAVEYQGGWLHFAATNHGLLVGAFGDIDMFLKNAADESERLDTDAIQWLVVPEPNHFVVKGAGKLCSREHVREVSVLLYGFDSCGVPIWECDLHDDRIRLVLFSGAYPTASNVLYDSQPGTSLDIDAFDPAVTMDPGSLIIWP